VSKIARLTPVPLRELWGHEALRFTRWLAENLDYLNEITGLTLTLVEWEASVGDFKADLLAEDEQGNLVVVECQLEKTDHDHLGKLLTYMSNMGAAVGIWITSQPRPEHEKAVHWLNEILPADKAFYLVQVEAYRIEDSPPAPKFTVIAGPSEQARQAGDVSKRMAERHRLYQRFWQSLLERAKGRTLLHANIKPGISHWLSAGAGKSGLLYNYVILMDAARVELFIFTGDAEANKRYFDRLYEHKEAIEQAFGAPLEWLRLDDKRASRIAYSIKKGRLRDEGTWPELQEAMIDAMIRLEKALAPHIRSL